MPSLPIKCDCITRSYETRKLSVDRKGARRKCVAQFPTPVSPSHSGNVDLSPAFAGCPQLFRNLPDQVS
jgi:hypothetical protein